MGIFVYVIGLVSVVFFLRYVKRKRDNPNGLPLPPGPTPLPLIGNLLDFPQERPWLTYDAMSQKYGEIFYLNVLGTPIVVLNSLKTVQDLMEKRSATYSDRINMPMLVDLMGCGFVIPIMKYGEFWRRHRKVLHTYFSPAASETFLPRQLHDSKVLIKLIKDEPEKTVEHMRFTLNSTTMNVSYGLDMKSSQDPILKDLDTFLEGFRRGAIYGSFLVDTIPLLKYIPTWFPGAAFQRYAAKLNALAHQVRDDTFNNVRKAMEDGSAKQCIASDLINNLPPPSDDTREYEEEVAKNVSIVALGAGGDTTGSYLHSFILAMLTFPTVQKKAQEELERVVGRNRLPDFNDKPSLPFVDALVKEVMRWQPVTPLAAPHATTASDEYMGYYIPNGALIIGNAWSILHDPVEYPNPEEFKPERFLTKDGKINPEIRDPEVAAFGWGRRICPGKTMALNNMFSILAHILHVFDILPPLDGDGKPIVEECKMTTGLFSHPEPFSYRIKPRAAWAEKLIDEPLV
ncbi:cytochrome P450 [Abortiporus biennis]|nr:cytochrome P450 [Abortiporus biennis]